MVERVASARVPSLAPDVGSVLPAPLTDAPTTVSERSREAREAKAGEGITPP